MRRRALAAVATQFFVNGFVVASFVPRLPEIRDELGISVGTLGIALSVAGLSGLAGSVLAAPLIGRVGTRRVMLYGSLALAGTLVAIGTANSVAMLIVGLAAFFIADVLVDVAMNLQASWQSARQPRPVINRLHALWSIGTVTGGLTAAQISSAGISLSVHLSAIALGLGGLVMVFSRRLATVDEPTANATDPATGTDSEPGEMAGRRSLVLLRLAMAGGFAIVVELTSSDWAAFRLADDFGASAGHAAYGYIAFTGGMTTGRLTGDWFLAKLGRTRQFNVAIGLAFAGLGAATLVPSRPVALAAFVLAGLGTATLVPKLYDEAAQLPGKPGAGVGALTAGNRVFGLIAPVVVGALAATSLTVGGALAIVTLPSAAALWLMVAGAPRRPISGMQA